MAPGQSTVGMGVGTGGSLFPGAHATGHGYLARWRFGATNQLDFGLDLVGSTHADHGTLTGSFSGGFRVGRHVKLELGFGGADDSSGKSVHADGAIVVGTDRTCPWNFYGAARIGGAIGIPPDVVGHGDPAPPDVLLGIASGGAIARLAPWARFATEIGAGPIFPADAHDTGLAVYVGAALIFDVAPR